MMSANISSDQGVVAMNTGPESATQPHTKEIPSRLELIEMDFASLIERIKTVMEPVETMLLLVEEGLNNIQVEVSTNDTGRTKSNSNAQVNAAKIDPVPSPSMIDKITSEEKYFPIKVLRRFAKGEDAKALNGLTFEEKIIMSSATIERNEMYQALYIRLEKLERQAVQIVIKRGIGYSPISDREDFIKNVEQLINCDDRIKALQSSLLKLRVKRYQLEEMLEKILEHIGTNSKSQSNISHQGASNDTADFTARKGCAATLNTAA